MAQSSDKASHVAGRYMNVTAAGLRSHLRADPGGLVRDIRAMAASVVRQDETKGLRGLVRKVLGK